MTKSHKRCVVVDVVGLTPSLLGENTPHINRYINDNAMSAMEGVFPAVTTTAQSSMLTGKLATDHGIVGNGWYDRDQAEVMFWKQSNRLVQAKKIWQELNEKHQNFRCSKLFWWYNMYADVDASITPRPHYPADGRKIIDLYSTPPGLHQQLESQLGAFPFFNFWGPKAGIESSAWIADAAMLESKKNSPDLQLVYLPHLDYCLQKFGPEHASIGSEVRAIDEVVGKLLDFYQSENVAVILVSEYGISAVNFPVHINRVLRESGMVKVRRSLDWEMLDPGASDAFAVADHQIAHVYVNGNDEKKRQVKTLLENTQGIERVLDASDKAAFGVAHERAGDLIAIAESGAWFTYYYWLDDCLAPDFARTVDIHRKPGYDPCEMFVDPQLSFPMGKVAWRLLQKKMGFRMLMDVIPIDASLIGGSHGRVAASKEEGPLIVLPKALALDAPRMVDVNRIVRDYFDA